MFYFGVTIIIIISITVGIFSVSATGNLAPNVSAIDSASAVDGIPLCVLACIAMAADKSGDDPILFLILEDMCENRWCQ